MRPQSGALRSDERRDGSAATGSAAAAAFSKFDSGAVTRRGWPARALAFNPAHRLTGGLRTLCTKLAAPGQGAAAPKHETLSSGRLRLSPAMPLLAHRYRYMHTLAQSDLSQLICAIDTFQHCAPTPEGRTQPLVAIKILNAQHWAIGAQEYERVRLVWHEQSRRGTCAPIVRALSHCEVGAHFCMVWEMLQPLWSIAPPPTAAPGVPSPDLAARCRPPVALVAAGAAGAVTAAAPSKARMHRLPLVLLRQLAYEILACLLVLQQQGVLHADVKPDNIMAEAPAAEGALGGGVRFRLIDFSNAMSLAESSAYHDSFDVQTLSYRAPEVVYGEPFAHPIDMWSLGVSLAELFAGRSLVQPASRGGLAVQAAQLLGRPHHGLFARSKYGAELLPLVQHTPEALGRPQLRRKLGAELGAGPAQRVHQLMDLLAGLLDHDPASRLTPAQALAHPLFHDAFPLRALLPDAPPPCAAPRDGEPQAAPATAPAKRERAPAPAEHTPRLSKRGAEPAASTPAEQAQPKRQAARR